ncbi:MAG: 50S ribosomal protein L11 methyltransferase [bacterium]
MTEPVWYRLELMVDADTAEDASGVLWDLGAGGVEVQDETTFMEGNKIPPVPEGRARLVGFFEGDDEGPATANLGHAAAALGDVVSLERFDDRSWETAWKDWFKPLRMSDRIVVGPPWETLEVPEGGVSVIIEPGMAFGTGTHETTQLCSIEVDRLLVERPGASVFDVGCGSAILAIAAAKLGANPVAGMDNDPVAIDVAKTNLEVNATPHVQLGTDSLDTWGQFDIVVANILAPILIELREQLLARIKPGGVLVLSGVTTSQVADFLPHFDQAPLTHAHSTSRGDWACMVLRHA